MQEQPGRVTMWKKIGVTGEWMIYLKKTSTNTNLYRGKRKGATAFLTNKNNFQAIRYSSATVLLTFFIGQLLLWAFPNGNSTWASVLFILMNLIPMIMAYVFSKQCHEITGVSDFLKKVLIFKERPVAYLCALSAAVIYYGISFSIGNVKMTGETFMAMLGYLPWALLQGGLEEVGWRWYLQPHVNIKNSFALKMICISVVWFIWHFPIYRLPWITVGSSNYFVFYLMILGNTFVFGTIKQLSRGAVPCILAHMLIDSLAVIMLVQSDVVKILILIFVEIVISVWIVHINFKLNPVSQS